jgi:hypothetical protein
MVFVYNDFVIPAPAFLQDDADVVEDAAGEEVILLRHDAEVLVEPGTRQLASVVSGDEDATALGQVELCNQSGDGAFAAAGRADDGDALSDLGGEADSLEAGATGLVRKADLAQFDVARETLGFGVEDGEDPLGPGHGGKAFAEHVPKDGDGAEKETGKEEELDQAAVSSIS